MITINVMIGPPRSGIFVLWIFLRPSGLSNKLNFSAIILDFWYRITLKKIKKKLSKINFNIAEFN